MQTRESCGKAWTVYSTSLRRRIRDDVSTRVAVSVERAAHRHLDDTTTAATTVLCDEHYAQTSVLLRSSAGKGAPHEFFCWPLFLLLLLSFIQESWGVVAGQGPAAPIVMTAEVWTIQKGYAEFFADLCVQGRHSWSWCLAGALFPLTLLLARLCPEMDPFRFRPSVVAAASIASARRTIKLFPMWPTHLQRVTKYEFDEIVACMISIWG